MVGPVVDENLPSPGNGKGRINGVGIGLGPGHGEADQLHGRKALREPAGHRRFVEIRPAAQGVTVSHGVMHGGLHRRWRETEEPRSEVSEKIREPLPIRRLHRRPLRIHKGQGKGRVKNRGPVRSARNTGVLRCLEGGGAFGVGSNILSLKRLQHGGRRPTRWTVTHGLDPFPRKPLVRFYRTLGAKLQRSHPPAH